jgi:hypothetical protein
MTITKTYGGRRGAAGKNLARLALAAAASATLLGGLAAPSHAAGPTVSVVAGNDVHYVGSDIQNDLLVTSDFTGAVFIKERNFAGLTPGPGCTATASQGIKCVTPSGSPDIDFIRLQMAGGSDEVTVQTSIRTNIEGGTGEYDTYFGGSTSTGTNVWFDGGPGIHDRADYLFSTSGVLVDIDNAADDGRLGRDADNITSTVEDLHGSDHDDSLRGNFANNWIVGHNGADALRGGTGNDEIWAWETNLSGSEADKPDLSCGKGIDIIILDSVDPSTAECEDIRRVS